MVRITADVGDLQRKMAPATRAVNQLGERAQAVGSALTVGLTLPLVGLATAAVGAAAEMDSLTRGLSAVSGSAAATQEQLSRLQEVAKLPGLGFREAIRGSISLQAAGLSASLAERSLIAFGNALATVGKGKADLDGITLALSQIASKGKISAEEINQLAERAPQVRQAMVAAFGTADTERLGQSGLSATEFITRLVDELSKLPQVTGGAANSFENLSDAWFRARAAIGQQLLPAVIPLVEGLANMLVTVRELNPNTVRIGIAFGAVAAALGPLLLVVGSLTVAITTLSTALTVSLLPLIAYGGPIVIGLAVVAAAFVKTGLDAMAAAANAEQAAARFRAAVTGMSDESLTANAISRNRVFANLVNSVNFTRQQIADATRTAQLSNTQSAWNEVRALRERLGLLQQMQTTQLTQLVDIDKERARRTAQSTTTPNLGLPTAGSLQEVSNELGKMGDELKEIFDIVKQLDRLTFGIDRLPTGLGGNTRSPATIRPTDLTSFAGGVSKYEAEAKAASDAAKKSAVTATTALSDLAAALGDVSQPLRSAITGIVAMGQGLKQMGQGGLAGLSGFGSLLGGLFSIGSIIQGLGRPDPVVQANTNALRDLSRKLDRFSVTFDAQAKALSILGQVKFGSLGATDPRIRTPNLNSLLASAGLTRDQLEEIAESFNIQLFKGSSAIPSAFKALEEALRSAQLSITNFAATIEGQWKLMDARAQIFDVTDPASLAQVELQKLLAGLSEAAEVQFGLVGLDLSSTTGQQALEEGLRALFEAFAAGGLDSQMLAGFESVDQFLQALLGTDSALDRLADSANRAGASLVNAVEGFKIERYRFDAQRGQGWTPPTGAGGPTDVGGSVPSSMTQHVGDVNVQIIAQDFRDFVRQAKDLAQSHPPMRAWAASLPEFV